jgi:tetratricopeptide (TPR) repeat protein
LHKLGRNEPALTAYTRAFELSGGRRELAVTIGRLLLEMRLVERALEFVRLQRRQSPEEIRLGHLEIYALLSLHRLPEALQKAEELARQFPASADAHYQLGVVRMGLRQLAEAESDLRRALELAPAHLPALSDLAVLLESQGRRAEAAALRERARALRPEESHEAGKLVGQSREPE